MTQPFDYSVVPHERRHGPRGYADYASYRPWLRDEFDFRCVYCLTRERWGQGNALFALDHFLPVAQHPDRVTDFDNLVFACATCNANKGGQIAPDPLSVLLSPLVSVTADGTMHTDAPEAARLIEVLKLNDPRMIEFRMHWIAIASLAALYEPELYRRLMGYPDDLPDLRRLQPPDGTHAPKAWLSPLSFVRNAVNFLRSTESKAGQITFTTASTAPRSINAGQYANTSRTDGRPVV